MGVIREVEDPGQPGGDDIGQPRRVPGLGHEQVRQRFGQAEPVRKKIEHALLGKGVIGAEMVVDPPGQPGQTVIRPERGAEHFIDACERPAQDGGLAAANPAPLGASVQLAGRSRPS
jgi:hypothetical protein